VETNKPLCKKCVGLTMYPTMKSADFTIEAIDKQHPGVQSLTVVIMNITAVVGMVFALVHSGIGNDYFKGANTCPALSMGRQALARFDANVFYYYKSSLATYCDIEDSFWRLLLDGWLRGVVSGSDSFLLLFSTLPKALLFKSAMSTFLRPVYAVLYAICGLFLSHIIAIVEDGGLWILHHIPGFSANGNAGSGRFSNFCSRVWRAPGQLKARLTTKSTIPSKARVLCLGVCVSTTLRLAVHSSGFHHLAALGTEEEVSTWQLMFEPVFFYWLSRQCAWVDSKLGKTIWKKGAAAAAVPLTLWREKPDKDVMEFMQYTRSRVMRSYNYYKQKAQDILHILIDDIFNMVVVLRLVIIAFRLSPLARDFASSVGLGEVIGRHREWFFEATGFQETDAGAKYITDKLLKFGFSETMLGVSLVGRFVEEEALEVFTHAAEFTHWIKQVVWRLLFPCVFYYLNSKWAAYLKKQQGSFKKKWEGTAWGDGQYAEMLGKYGSYWNEVTREEWRPPAKK